MRVFRLHGNKSVAHKLLGKQRCILCSVYLEHCADDSDASSDPDLDKPQSSSSSGLVAGAAVSVVVLVIAVVCIVVLVVWWR